MAPKSPSLLVFCLAFSLAVSLAAQSPISGRVVDAASGVGVDYATVQLIALPDSNVVGGAVAGAGGVFEVQADGQQKSDSALALTVSFVGYATTTYGPLSSWERRGEQAPMIELTTAAAVLDAVEVTARELMELHRIDRQIFRADQFANARGGTATDVLRNLPAVTFTPDGGISLRGSNGFQLVIDGRPIQGHAEDYLAQLPANAIASVEFITTPSARYDPDGTAGILNIVTKQGTGLGWTVAANAMLGAPSIETYGNAELHRRYGADVSANYRSRKFEFSAGADYRRDDLGGRRIGYVNTYEDEILTELPSAGERSFDERNYSGRLSFAYQPNRASRLEAGVYAGIRDKERTADILYTNQQRTRVRARDYLGYPDEYYQRYLVTGDVLDDGEVLTRSTFFNENLRVRRGDFFISSLDYDRELSENTTLRLGGLYERTVLGGPTDNRILSWPELTDTLQLQRNDNDNPLDGLRFRADLDGKLGEGGWRAGYQFRYLRHPGDFLYLDRDFEGGGFTVNPEFTNGILLRRDIHSLYSETDGQLGERLSYRGGLRLEYFDRRVTIDRPDTTYRLDRVQLFPSANLSYALGQEGRTALRAGYSRRIERTTTFKMTPFPEREHNETLEQGDAELLPELIDQVEAGITHSWGDNSVFATAYYRHVADVINRVNTVYNDTILNRIYTNAGDARAYGLEAGLTLYPTPAVRVYLAGNAFNYRIRGRLFEREVNTATTVFSLNPTVDVDIREGLSAQFSFNYLSDRVTAQGVDSRFYTAFASLRQTLLDDRLSILLQWQNIDLGMWDANQQSITTVQANFFTTTDYVYEVDMIRLSVGYRFTRLDTESRGVESEFGAREF